MPGSAVVGACSGISGRARATALVYRECGCGARARPPRTRHTRPMIDLTFARDVDAALAGARMVLVLAPQRRFTRRVLGRFLPAEHARLLAALAADASPGDLGCTASTLAAGAQGTTRSG